MATTVTLSDFRGATVSVEIEASKSQLPLEFRNPAMNGVPTLNAAVAPHVPFLTYKAIESACLSGVIYARRELKLTGVFVELVSYSFSGTVQNAEPFAYAVAVAVSRALGDNTPTFAPKLEGWNE